MNNKRIKEMLEQRLKQLGLLGVLGLGFGVLGTVSSQAALPASVNDQGVTSADLNATTGAVTYNASAADKFAVLNLSAPATIAGNDVTLSGPGTIGMTFAAAGEYGLGGSGKAVKIAGDPKLLFFSNVANGDVTIKGDNIDDSVSKAIRPLLLTTGENKLIFGSLSPNGGDSLRIISGKAGLIQMIAPEGVNVKALVLGAAAEEKVPVVRYKVGVAGTIEITEQPASGGNLLVISGGASKSVLASEGGVVYGESSLKIGNANAVNNVLNLGRDLVVTEGAILTLAGTDMTGNTASSITIKASKTLDGSASADKSGNIVISKGATVRLLSNVILSDTTGKKLTSGFVLSGDDDAENKTIAKLLADGGARTITIQNESSVPVIQVADGSAGLIGGNQPLILSSVDGKDVLVQVGAGGMLKIDGLVTLDSKARNEGSFQVKDKATLVFINAPKSQLNVGANDRIVFAAKSGGISFDAPEKGSDVPQLILASVDSLVNVGDTKIPIDLEGKSFIDLGLESPGKHDYKVVLIGLGDGKFDDLMNKIDCEKFSNSIVADVNIGVIGQNLYGINGYESIAYGDALADNAESVSGISEDFVDVIESMQGAGKPTTNRKKLFGMLTARYDEEEEGFDNGDLARSISRSTAAERNRVTMAIANMARGAAYSHMCREIGDKELWAAGMGDLLRQKEVNGYGMRAGLWGLAIGYDMNLSDESVLGLLAGYGHAKMKYNGSTLLDGNNGSQRSFFGGVYGEWNSLENAIRTKFSALMGRSKYKEWGNRPVPGTKQEDYSAEIARFSSSHRGYWASLNVDCVYLPWEYNNIKFGPWVALTYDYVNQKNGSESVDAGLDESDDNPTEPTATSPGAETAKSDNNVAKESEDWDPADGLIYSKSKCHMLSPVIGIHAETDLSLGKVFAEVGYKRELWKKNKVGTVEYYDEEYSPALGNVGKNSCVVRLGYGLTKNNWGFDLGLEGQFSKNWKDYSANIAATYSF
ncbi:MAG: autotransporter outer membrane beta-barrel domain-containing protein [Puniceicoccales bacterium]|jgi:hypothetical protein|nr:autotransporter outer membrane beta-barrel domain-containing protein [Puniceicoccales bacterium]